MEPKTAKMLDRAPLNLKRKLATTPTNRVAKQMRSGLGISCSLVRYYLNYKKSGRPERLMSYKNAEWVDYPKDVVDLVKKDFEIKKAVLEVELNGNAFVLDFLHMYQMDLKTGLQQPIAWIDEAGCCFFPEVYAADNEKAHNFGELEGGESHPTPECKEIKLHLAIENNRGDRSKSRECSEESNALLKDVKVGGSIDKMDNKNVGEAIKQEQDIELDANIESVYRIMDLDSVQKMFLTGMANLGISDADIVEIYRCSGMSMQARLELFQKQAEIIKGTQGDANVRNSWIAFSKGELSTMIEYGLCHCELSAPNNCIYGSGIHLAAQPDTCAPYGDVDENGVRHLILCRVIMGNMELLRPDSGQTRPTSFEFCNGVDDLQHPRYYIVWNMNVNTHIYPEFVVSYKVPLDAEGHFGSCESKKNVSRDNVSSHGSRDASTADTGMDGISQERAGNVVANNQRVPTSPWLPFPLVFAAIRNRIPPNDMNTIGILYAKFRARQITRSSFVMKLRLIVGDNLLRATIISLQYMIPTNFAFGGANNNQG